MIFVAGIKGTGVTSGFGSVFINGREFDTENAEIFFNGERVSEDRLRVGDQVTYEGFIDADGRAVAARIEFVRVVDGPIQVLDLQNGVGTVSTLGQIVRVEIDSIITDFNGLGDFMLNGQPVNAANATRADMSGLAPGNGVRVEVEGELRLGVVVAESLAVRPSASIRFDAVVDSVSANRFSLLGVDAQVQPTTQYLDENLRTFRIGDLSPGDYVYAQGYVNTAGQLMIARLQRQDAVSDSQARGHVDSFDQATGTLIIRGVTVRTNDSTQFKDAGGNAIDASTFFANLNVNDPVLAFGPENANEINIADSVQILASDS